MKERTKLMLIIGAFLAAYFVPWNDPVVRRSGLEAFLMLQEYARQHVLTCLIPAFFIAGAIAVFVSQASVVRYFGAQASKILSYSVASVSGAILAVCSCTVLPLFAGIYTRGAGIGPATAFLYSGPAINVLAITLTAKILGWKPGLARAVGAVLFAVVTGLLMAVIFHKDDNARTAGQIYVPEDGEKQRTLTQDSAFIGIMVLILITATFAKPGAGVTGLWPAIYAIKWYLTGALLLILIWMVKGWFDADERRSWIESTWGFMKQIFPLLGAGVLVAGFMLGRPGQAWAPSANTRALYPVPGGRQFTVGQSVRLCGWCLYVFRHLNRGADPARPSGLRHGPGPRASPVASWPGPVTAEHVGHRLGDGDKKNGNLLRHHCCDVYHRRDALWLGGRMINQINCKGGTTNGRKTGTSL